MRRVNEQGADEHEGRILTEISDSAEQVHIRVTDNGMGWPFRDKERLLEPYVTTRDTGTGLGFAIVKRIVEDHGGHIRLDDPENNAQGAVINLVLPINIAPANIDAANDTDISTHIRPNLNEGLS